MGRDWDAIPDPLGGEALPLVMDVYGWLSLATSGTTRGLRNRPFDAVLLRRDRGNWEVPLGGQVPREEHKRVLRAVLRAGWPHRGLTWPAFLKGGVVFRGTDAEANNWLPRACTPPSPTGATARGTRRRRSPNPHASGGAGHGHAQRQWSGAQQAGPRTPSDGHRGVGADQWHGAPPRQARAPPP